MFEIANWLATTFHYIYTVIATYTDYVLIGFKVSFESSILNCFLSAKKLLAVFYLKWFLPQLAGVNKSVSWLGDRKCW